MDKSWNRCPEAFNWEYIDRPYAFRLEHFNGFYTLPPHDTLTIFNIATDEIVFQFVEEIALQELFDKAIKSTRLPDEILRGEQTMFWEWLGKK